MWLTCPVWNLHVHFAEQLSCVELISVTDTTEKKAADDDPADKDKVIDDNKETDPSSPDAVLVAMETTLQQKQAEKLTVLDIFRHKRLFLNALVAWLAW